MDQNHEMVSNSDPFRGLCSGSSGEVYWRYPQGQGRGYMSLLKLRPGFLLGIGDFELTEQLSAPVDDQLPSLVLSYSLSGSMEYAHPEQGSYAYRSGHGVLSYAPEGREVAGSPAHVPIKCVGLFVDPQVLYEMMQGQIDVAPKGVQKILNGAQNCHYYQETITPALIHMLIQEMITCQYKGALRRIFLEGKALELLTCSLSQMATGGELNAVSVLRPKDIDGVQWVKEIIDQRFQEELRLFDLAREAGLPHSKLNACFRQLHGTTVFGYIRQRRLNKAKLLLSEKRMNVTEAAFSVGYSSLSHFSKSFKDHFGVYPGDYLHELLHPPS